MDFSGIVHSARPTDGEGRWVDSWYKTRPKRAVPKVLEALGGWDPTA